MEHSLLVLAATRAFAISGTLLLAILGYLLVFRALAPAIAGLLTSFREELAREPLMAILSALMLVFLVSAILLAICNPTGLRLLLRPLVFA